MLIARLSFQLARLLFLDVIGAGGVQDANITAGAVINETRDLAASVIGTTRSVVRSYVCLFPARVSGSL